MMAAFRRGHEAYPRDERVFEITEFVEQLRRTMVGPAPAAPRGLSLARLAPRVCRHVGIAPVLGLRPHAVYQAVARGRHERMK